MKAWVIEHKFYFVCAGALLVLGGLYYFFIFQPNASSEQQITGFQNGSISVKTEEKESSSQAGKKQTEQTNQPNQGENVMVDVKGEVKQPGVYHSNKGERVMDVIQRAGGLTDHADQSQVNFAAHVQDEMVITVPAKGEVNGNSPFMRPSQGEYEAKINVNIASESELQNLPGVGPAKAAAIIQYRQQNGPYKAIEDLKKISGIGDKTFEKLKESISVS